jgi:outer membrane protein OmpU
MTNFKKIGLTALAASLVSVSAHAGSLTASGSASMNSEGHTGKGLNAGTTFSMANSVTLTGSGELDNGLTASVSFEMDQGTANNSDKGFDNHSVTISSDDLGTLTLAGHGGSSATSAIDTTAAGDMWDNFDQLSNGLGITYADGVTANGGTDNSFFY